MEATIVAISAREFPPPVAPSQAFLPSVREEAQRCSLATGQVVNVVDGDTIDVLIGGAEYRVRYIGIDTPETVDPTRGEEPHGKEASDRHRVHTATRRSAGDNRLQQYWTSPNYIKIAFVRNLGDWEGPRSAPQGPLPSCQLVVGYFSRHQVVPCLRAYQTESPRLYRLNGV